jgi:hypothetical protein
MKKPLFALMLSLSLVTPMAANAMEDIAPKTGIVSGPTALLSITSPIVASTSLQIGSSQTLAMGYIQKQLAAYSLDQNQLLSLPVALQREVLSLDGRQMPLSIAERKQIVLFRSVVPGKVMETVKTSRMVDATTLGTYGVRIPASVTAIPEGYEQWLLGNKLLVIDTAGHVLQAFSL